VCYDCGDGTKYGKEKLVKPEGTLLSSVHRAKGLEAKRVFILRPDLMPHPKAKSAWEKGQEANLEYVAITRAIEELVYVDGSFKQKEEGGDNA
jgi:superfamily I DNA/RNA helicase